MGSSLSPFRDTVPLRRKKVAESGLSKDLASSYTGRKILMGHRKGVRHPVLLEVIHARQRKGRNGQEKESRILPCKEKTY
jgi:hypothetical protein